MGNQPSSSSGGGSSRESRRRSGGGGGGGGGGARDVHHHCLPPHSGLVVMPFSPACRANVPPQRVQLAAPPAAADAQGKLEESEAQAGKEDEAQATDGSPDAAAAAPWRPFWVELVERLSTAGPWNDERLESLLLFNLERLGGLVERAGSEKGLVGGLFGFLGHDLDDAARAAFYSDTMPFVAAQVLRLPELFGAAGGAQPLEALVPLVDRAVSLTETQICALVCTQFLCAVPDQHVRPLTPADLMHPPPPKSAPRAQSKKGKKPAAAEQDAEAAAAAQRAEKVEEILHERRPDVYEQLAEACTCVAEFPCANFVGPNSTLLCGRRDQGHMTHQAAKLHCLLAYFDQQRARAAAGTPERTITFRRRVLNAAPCWADSTAPLTRVRFPPKSPASASASSAAAAADGEPGANPDEQVVHGKVSPLGIESATHQLQADFANRFIGGGVLQQGCVQEEIRFAVSPELYASMIFCAAMRSNEAIVVSNTEVLCDHTGYGTTFTFAGVKAAREPSDMVAIDALDFRMGVAYIQFNPALIDREINKAYIGFVVPAHSRSIVRAGPKQKKQKKKQTAKTDTTTTPPAAAAAAAATAAATAATDEDKKDVDGSASSCSSSSSSSSSSSASDDECSSGSSSCSDSEDEAGPVFYPLPELAPLAPVATGAWGAGAFRNELELKAVQQWLAASQAQRDMTFFPFTRGYIRSSLKRLAATAEAEGATVGDVYRALRCVCDDTEFLHQAITTPKLPENAIINRLIHELQVHGAHNREVDTARAAQHQHDASVSPAAPAGSGKDAKDVATGTDDKPAAAPEAKKEDE